MQATVGWPLVRHYDSFRVNTLAHGGFERFDAL
jgi:hypothetical protein